jgi:hypothetical protein
MLNDPSRALLRTVALAAAAALVLGLTPTPARAADPDPTPNIDFTLVTTWADLKTTPETDYVLVKDADGLHRFDGTNWTSVALPFTCDATCSNMSFGRVSDSGIVPVLSGTNISLYDVSHNEVVAGSLVTLSSGATDISANTTTAVFKLGGEWYYRDLAAGSTEEKLAANPERIAAIPGLESSYDETADDGSIAVKAPRVLAAARVTSDPDVAFQFSVASSQEADAYNLFSLKDNASLDAFGVVGDLMMAKMSLDYADGVHAQWVHMHRLMVSESMARALEITGKTLLSITAQGVLTSDDKTGELHYTPVFRTDLGAHFGTEGVLTPPTGLKLDFASWQSTGTPIAKFTDADGVVGLIRLDCKLATDAATSSAAPELALTELYRFTVVGTQPTITGVASYGQTLTANVGTWAPSSAALTYQWLADGVAIASATNATYALTEAEIGKKVTVQVTGAKPGYQSDTQTSEATLAVTDIAPGTVAIAGTAAVGQALSATVASWPTGTTYAYQWLRGTTVVGTNATYTVATADAGNQLTVQVTGTVAGHSALVAVSAPVSIAGSGRQFTSAPRPVILGSARVGGALVAFPGIWRPVPTKLTLQWYRNGVAIPGATKAIYRPTRGDRGAKITVAVTATKAGYVTTTKLSNASNKVK